MNGDVVNPEDRHTLFEPDSGALARVNEAESGHGL